LQRIKRWWCVGGLPLLPGAIADRGFLLSFLQKSPILSYGSEWTGWPLAGNLSSRHIGSQTDPARGKSGLRRTR